MAENQVSSYCLPFQAVVRVNKVVLEDWEPHTILDEGKILGALGRPLHTFEGAMLFGTAMERAGALIQGLATAHGFVEGNKRTSFICGMFYLESNGFKIQKLPPEVSGPPLLDLVNHNMTLREYTLWLTDHLLTD